MELDQQLDTTDLQVAQPESASQPEVNNTPDTGLDLSGLENKSDALNIFSPAAIEQLAGGGDPVKKTKPTGNNLADANRLSDQLGQSFKDLQSEGLDSIVNQNTDKTRIARTFNFDPEATNFERFRTSPCYDKLGFNPLGDLKELEREYVECEKQHYMDTSYTVLKYLGMTCLIGAIVYFGIRKSK